MSQGLYRIARRDKKERELHLMGVRERAEHAAKVKIEKEEEARRAEHAAKVKIEKEEEEARKAAASGADAAKAAEGSSQPLVANEETETEAAQAGDAEKKSADEPMKDAEGQGAVGCSEKVAEGSIDEATAAPDAAGVPSAQLHFVKFTRSSTDLRACHTAFCAAQHPSEALPIHTSSTSIMARSN